jgi:hypothetical protein
MASWQEFAEQKPELSQTLRTALWHEKQGLNFAYLATVRQDGTPRIHPVCPTFWEGDLYLVAEGKTPKKRDLYENGRYALHTTLSFKDLADADEVPKQAQVYISGQATEQNDPETRKNVESTYREWKFGPDEVVFRLSIERALHTTWKDGYVWDKWSAE